VRGLGINQKDLGGMFGSDGVLRSVLNMKRVWQGVNQDTETAWRPLLEVWGQESGHRWMVFMGFRDPRTGLVSDALLGRDCSHYSRFVDTQGSVHDGLAWTDNHDGTFTAAADRTFQYGNLDLYGMGLMPAEEMPSFFFIDDVPGYKRGTCREYANNPKPLGQQDLRHPGGGDGRRRRRRQRPAHPFVRRAAGRPAPGLLPRGAGGGHPTG
jgi:hypothetical protein